MRGLGLGYAPPDFALDPQRAALRKRFGLGVNLTPEYLDALPGEQVQPAAIPAPVSAPVSEPEQEPASLDDAMIGKTVIKPKESFYSPEDREVYLRGFYGAEESSAHNLSNFGELAKFLSRTAAGIGNVRGEMAKTAVPEFVEGLTEANRRHIDKQRQLDAEMDKAIRGRKDFESEQVIKSADAKLKAEALRIKTGEAQRKEREQSALGDPESADSAMWRQLAGTMIGQEIDPSVTGAALKGMAAPFAQVYAGMNQEQREQMRRTAEEKNLATKLQAERESQAAKLDSERELLLKRLESSDAQAAAKLRAEMDLLDRRLRLQAEEAERARGFKGSEAEKDRTLKTEMQGAELGVKVGEGAATREAKAAADEAARKAKATEAAAEREFKGTEAMKERGLKRDLGQAQIQAKTGQDAELIRLREQEAAAKAKQAAAELAVKSAKNELDRKARLKIAADARASAEKIAAMRAAAEKARGVKPGAAPKAPKTPATPKPGEQYKQIDQLRSEYTKLPIVKESQTIRSSWSRIQGAFKDPSAAGDLNLIFGYMKLLDPGSTVREGEFATAQNSGSAWNKVGALYNQVVSGERLTSRQRADFQKSAGDLYKGQMSRLRETNAFYKNLAKQRGLKAEDLGLIGERKKIRLPSGFKGKRIAYKGVPYVWNETEKVYEEEE